MTSGGPLMSRRVLAGLGLLCCLAAGPPPAFGQVRAVLKPNDEKDAFTPSYVAFSPGGKYVAAGGYSLQLYEADTGKYLSTFAKRTSAERNLVFTDDRRLVYQASSKGLTFIDVTTEKVTDE